MGSRWAKLFAWVPAALAFALLVWQAAIPWTVPRLVTQDGPSHLYTATVARTMLLNRHSVYRPFYRFNHRVVPNWGSTVSLALLESIFGADHAEQAFMSLSFVLGFFAFGYALKSLDPEGNPWNPVANVMLQSWFVWIGYSAFFLGMAVCPFVIGFYIRRIHRLNIRTALMVAAGLAVLFLTHLIPAVLAAIAIAACSVCVHLPGRTRSLRSAALTAFALAPLAVLLGLFALFSAERVSLKASVASLMQFPGNIFVTAAGKWGTQVLLWPAVLGFICIGMLMTRPKEWLSAKGGVAAAALIAFGLYMIVPDSGFGGQGAKERFAWAVFILGALAVCSLPVMKTARLVLAIYAAGLLVPNLLETQRALAATDRAIAEYLTATAAIPKGAKLIRLGFPAAGIPDRFGFGGIGRNPIYHADAYVAARCGCVDLTDYQVASKVFPIDFKPAIDDNQRYALWALENEQPGDRAGEAVKWLRDRLPVPVDYVIVVADPASDAGPNLAGLMANLNAGMTPVSGAGQFVRVYKRTRER